MEQTRKNKQNRQLIIHSIAEIIELYPHYTVAEHLSYLCDKSNFFKWSDEEFFSRIEKYRDKLDEDPNPEEDELF